MNIFKCVQGAMVAAALTLSPLSAMALDTIRLGYQKVPPLTPIAYGLKAGIFEKNGLNVSLIVVNGASELVTGLASGTLDIVALPAAAGVQARAAGLDVKAIGSSAYEWPGKTEFQIVANGDKGIKSAKDLEGHVVGILEKKSPAEMHIRDHMLADGGDPEKVTFVALPFPQLPAALEVGNVDAIGIAPPFLNQILASTKIKPVVVGEGMIASLKEDGQAALGSWFSMGPWIADAKNRDVTARFLKSVMEANRELMADRSKIDAVLQEAFGMPPAVAGHIPMELETKSLVAKSGDYAPTMRAYERTGMAKVNYTAEDLVETIDYE